MSVNASGAPARVLVVEDERDIAALVAYHLTREGYRVSTTASGDEALRAASTERPDIVVLDLMLPGLSGYDVIQELRRRPGLEDVPVVFLTARREEADRIRGLELGADDYITKPFSPQELVLRVGTILRRVRAPAVTGSGRTVRIGPVEADLDAKRVSVAGRELTLTPTEYRLLTSLMERRGRVQTRKQLLQSAWDVHVDIETRTVDMHIQRLRHKLGEAGDLIETARGFGYRFRADDQGS
ncbi:MAG TPA: response regulator transcription factor [Longimicrobiales bacterium]|nr:response regulator transcription factor [Longimicrobiales bacterium]